MTPLSASSPDGRVSLGVTDVEATAVVIHSSRSAAGVEELYVCSSSRVGSKCSQSISRARNRSNTSSGGGGVVVTERVVVEVVEVSV